jgi:outer membrane protein assembly factor BamB
MTNSRSFLLFLTVLLSLSVGAGAQESDDGGGGNWMESLLNTVRDAAEDPETQEEGSEAVGNALDFLNQLNQKSEAAREEVMGQELLDPDQFEQMMADVNRRIEAVQQELDAAETRLFAAELEGLSMPAARGRRISPLQVIGSGLAGAEVLRLVSAREAELTEDGTLLIAGQYARQTRIGTTALRSSTASLSTDTIGLSTASTLRPGWLLESYGEYGSSVGVEVESTRDRTYVLGLSQGGPIQVGRISVDHPRFDSYAYLTRLDSAGEPRWIAALAKPLRFNPHDATMAAGSGRVYVGYFLKSPAEVPVATEQNLRTGTATYGEGYRNHQLLAAYSADGTRLWQTVAENVQITAMDTGPDGALYAAGHFSESSTLCGGISTRGDQAAFVARFSANGTCDWVRTTTGSTGRRDSSNELMDQPGGINSFRAVAVDGDAVYAGGSFFRATEFGGRQLREDEGASTGLLVRLDAETGETEWLQTREPMHDAGAPPVARTGGYVYTAEIVPDGLGNIYVLEPRYQWQQVADQSGGRIDSHIVKFDRNGNLLWQESTGVSTAYYDTGGNQPKGVQLVEANDGPPYLLVQYPTFSLDGVAMPAADQGAWLIAIGRLGR